MARTKNRGLQQSFSPSYTVRRWRLGEYIRLSKEDLKKGKDDSNSVINQRDLLNDFYQKHIGEFESVSEYVDDGHTGTDANRENFQRLLSDVMSGKINCVVVKDLSRFARNYSDAGSLIDNLFVQMGVRFISLAENVDSYLNPDSVSSIIVPITNVMNDQYCYQTSKKIRQVFDYKRRNGQYIGAVAPESLPDVSGMAFDTSLPREERIALFLQAVENPYCFCIGGIGVKIEFAESGPSLQDTLTDFLLRQKSGL